MRTLVISLLLVGATARAQAPAPLVADDKVEKVRAAEAAEVTRKAAEAFTLTSDKASRLTLEPKSLLQWSNPVAGSIHGSVFVWTERGCPEVVASIYKFYAPENHLGVEFHSLTSGLVKAEQAGQVPWTPGRAGVDRKPIPGAPEPAATAPQRLRQLRALAKEFGAEETTRTDVRREIRLLTQPIFRYASTDPDVLDGGLFAFVEGTDPELLLVVEARKGPKGFAWQYAFARVNSLTLRASHKGREVWSAATIPWSQAFDRREPYTLIVFDPGQGVNPPGRGASK